MFVITADQIDSRAHTDAAGAERDRINQLYGEHLVLPADRNAGDEIQMLTADAATALRLMLELTRTEHWSVGVGCGSVRQPLPSATREATGPAFYAARDAVQSAKKRRDKFALVAQTDDGERIDNGIDALISLLLVIRGRRTAAGWELYDLLVTGITQAEAAERLSISAPAVSSRVHAANIREEEAVIPALTKLLHDLDAQFRTDE